MGSLHNRAPVNEEGLKFNSTGAQEYAPEDRTLHLLMGRDVSQVSEREEQETDRQRTGIDPREQIHALYDEYRPRLFRYIRSMKIDRDQTEELIQETFVRLTTQLLRKTDIENVQGWIVRVAHNLAVDLHKRNDRDAVRTSETSNAIENRVDPAHGPEEVYLKKEEIKRMEMALSTLNPQQRHCFDMRAQGFRYKDIGLALGISEQRAALVLKQVAVRLAAICG